MRSTLDTRSTMQQTNSHGTSNQLVTYLSMTRPINCLMIGLAVIVGEVINLGNIPPLDKLVFALLLGLASLLIALVALGLMVFYNVRGKRLGLLGNAVVSFNVALPFAFGGISVSSLHPAVVLFSMLAFLSNLGREIAKGIADVQGDSIHSVRTLAVLKGPRVAALTSSGLFLAAVVVSFVPPFLGIVSVLYIPAVLIADFGFVFSSMKLVSDSSPENAKKVKNRVLLWMLLGLIAFLLGGLSLPVSSL